MNLPPQQRSQADGPWCWQNKAARRLIRKRFSELNCISSALSVYDALCELASDVQTNSFEMATPTIAKTAGVGTRTAQHILPKLKIFGFIKIDERKFSGTNMDAPSVYTLLRIDAENTQQSNGCAPVSNGCAPLRNGHEQTSLRTSEESLKESSEKSPKTSISSSTSVPQPQAVGGREKIGASDELLTPGEIWFRTCQVLGRSMEQPRSEPEDGVLLLCHTWLTEADLQLLEGYERRLQSSHTHRSMTAYTFLHHAAARLRDIKARTAAPANHAAPAQRASAQPFRPAQPPVCGKEEERLLSLEEIWGRVCRIVGRAPEQSKTAREVEALQENDGWISEADVQMLEWYAANVTRQGHFRKRTARTLLTHLSDDVKDAWVSSRTFRSLATTGSAANVSAPAKATEAKRPTADEVFAYISPAGWKREVAQAYIDARTRTDPPWHLPATNDRLPRLISADWHIDVNRFLQNWNTVEDRKKKHRDEEPF